jgi:hypothetical protein
MACYQGGTRKAMVDRGPLDLEEVLEVVLQAGVENGGNDFTLVEQP